MKMCFGIIAALMFSSFALAGETVIPQDSKAEWDFRAKGLSPFLLGSPTAKQLPDCKTYEELRDTLKKVIPELIHCGY